MSEILDLNARQASPTDDECIQIEYSAECYSTAEELSVFISLLPISVTENDRLIQLILNHVQAYTQNGFNQGFKMGTEFQKFMEKENAECTNKGTTN